MGYLFQKVKVLPLLILVLLTACLPGCQEQSQPPGAGRENERHQKKTFTIGIIPEENVFELKKKYLPLMKYLADKLDMNVNIKLLESYGAVDGALAKGSIDGAMLGATGMVMLYNRRSVELIARPDYAGTSSFYRACIITWKGSGVSRDVGTWKGKKLALVHELTTPSIYLQWYLKKQGIDMERQFFQKVEYAGSHDAAAVLVLEGKADIGGAKSSVIRRFMDVHPFLKERLVILAESEPVPELTLAVNANVDREVKSRLRNTLLGMHDQPAGRAALKACRALRFVKTTYGEYAPLIGMLRELGIDPKTYRPADTDRHK